MTLAYTEDIRGVIELRQGTSLVGILEGLAGRYERPHVLVVC
jgi:hypothetical protein